MALYDWQKITRVLPLNPYGKGVDGNVTISSNQTASYLYKYVSGSAGSNTVSLNQAAFSNGDLVKLIQLQNNGSATAGNWEINQVVSGGGTTSLTLKEPLKYDYTDTSGKAIIIKLYQYKNYTIDSGVTLSIPAWNGSGGGILPIVVSDTLTIDGNINANGKGFRGGAADGGDDQGWTGEGSGSASVRNTADPAGNGGGTYHVSCAGGGHASTMAGDEGTYGSAVGDSALTTLFMGGGGGAGSSSNTDGAGGNGAGIVVVFAKKISVGGYMYSNGNAGGNTSSGRPGSGGAGGAILLCGETVSIGTDKLRAQAGAAGTGGGDPHNTAGSKGRIAVYYGKSLSGSVSSTYYGTLTTTQDKDFIVPPQGGFLLMDI